MADGEIKVFSTDIKSPRDLALHMKAVGVIPTTKKDVEDQRNEARDYDGTGPATPEGKWNEVGDDSFIGPITRYKP